MAARGTMESRAMSAATNTATKVQTATPTATAAAAPPRTTRPEKKSADHDNDCSAAPGDWATSTREQRNRVTVSVPLARLLSPARFAALAADLGRTPAGVVALFLAAAWMFAQAMSPPETDGQKGARSSGDHPPHSGAVTFAVPSALAQAQSFTRPGFSFDRMIAALAPSQSQSEQAQEPLTVVRDMAESILPLLMDESVTETRDSSTRRHLREMDRAVLERVLRGCPGMIARFCCADDDAATGEAAASPTGGQSHTPAAVAVAADCIRFTVEENSFSADAIDKRTLTLFVSQDAFRHQLSPVKLRRSREGLWRVYNFYGLLYLPSAAPTAAAAAAAKATGRAGSALG